MALKRLRFLFLFFFLVVFLSLIAILLPPRLSQASHSSIVSYASALHSGIANGLGYLPSKAALTTLVPSRLKWSSWATSDAVRLEESLLGPHPNRNFSSLSSLPASSSPSQTSPNAGDAHYHPNGFYFLSNPSLDKHPIQTLIHNAERLWSEKLARNSQTLEACVREYRRRYNQPPPYGFEKWWEYAVQQGVVLKDEYDQIQQDLKPFLAIEPSDLHHRSWVMANERPETFTLSTQAQKVSISGAEGHLDRAKDLAKLLRLFADRLPEDDEVFNMTFTKHDQPAVQMTWARKQKMMDMADVGEYFSPSDYIRPADPKLTNWANACPPSSALYRNESKALPAVDVPEGKSFIYDHVRAMEVCGHPESMKLHGFTSAPGTDNAELVPLFTFAKATTQSDVLATPLEQYSDTYIGADPDWAHKTINKLLWRGSTTGAEFMTGVDWQSSQRARLHIMTHLETGQVDVLRPDGRPGTVKRDVAELNRKLMDTSFSGGPVQCDPPTCEYMSKTMNFAHTMGLDESYQYKYLIDLDGNGWSGRFHRLMSTKSCVLKSTIFPEWYADRVQPWLHYVPIKVDYSDLYDVMLFFAGDVDGTGGHDELASKIASEGKKWAAEHWRRVDMAAYMFRLLLEWRRVMLRETGQEVDYLS